MCVVQSIVYFILFGLPVLYYIATISGSTGSVSVWSLGLLADLEKLRYRFGGPEEFWLISKWRLLPSGKRPDENFG